MLLRRFTHWTIGLSLFLATAAVAFAEKSHDGKVVSVTEATANTDGKLVMTNNEDKNQHSHAISSTVTTTRNGKTAKLGDLKKGDSVTVTTDDNGKVTKLAAKSSSTGKSSANGKEELPDILKNLKLTSDQQTKIDDITRKFDAECESAWNDFSQLYRKAIRTEASMLAAIEDGLSDSQRQRLRQQRQRTSRQDEKEDSGSDTRSSRDNSQQDGVEEEIFIFGITLSPEQQQSSQTTRAAYIDRLRETDQAIEALHARMISLEIDKLLEIEKVLSKEQREQLRKDHQSLTSAARDVDDKRSK